MSDARKQGGSKTEKKSDAYAPKLIDIGLTKKHIGKGSFGEVYVAEPKFEGNPTSLKNKKFVVKVFKKSKYDPEEAEIWREQDYIAIEKTVGGVVYLLLEYMPGKTISQSKSEISQLTLLEKINLSTQLIFRINQLHHTKVRKDAIIHGDLKNNNIKVVIDLKTRKTDVHLLDYNISLKMTETDDPETLMTGKIPGPEKSKTTGKYGLFGVKTDIDMIANVIFNIIESDKFPTLFDINIKKLVHDYLKKMSADNYSDRPNSDEVLKFFTTLRTILMIYKNPSLDKDQTQLKKSLATLWLLNHGMWNEKLDVTDSIITAVFNIFAKKSPNFTLELYDVFLSSPTGAAKAFANTTLNKMLDNYVDSAREAKTEETIQFQRCVNFMNALFSPAIRLHDDVKNNIINYLALHPAFLSEIELPLNKINAKNFITNLINHARTPDDVDAIIKNIKSNKNLKFLWERSGITHFSIHSHKVDGVKVSGTWVAINKHAEDIKTSLSPEKKKHHSEEKKSPRA